MRKITTLMIAGMMSFAGFTTYAQSPMDLEEVMRSLSAGGGSASITEIVQGVMDTSTPTTQITIIDAPLIVDVEVPAVNLTTAPAYLGDAQTGRYPPRLKIDFAEFPLRSLAATNRTEMGRTGNVVQRVQSRLRASKINLVVNDRTAIVSGTVATERQRDLAEAMLRFEPGIDAVQNEITVAP